MDHFTQNLIEWSVTKINRQIHSEAREKHTTLMLLHMQTIRGLEYKRYTSKIQICIGQRDDTEMSHECYANNLLLSINSSGTSKPQTQVLTLAINVDGEHICRSNVNYSIKKTRFRDALYSCNFADCNQKSLNIFCWKSIYCNTPKKLIQIRGDGQT